MQYPRGVVGEGEDECGEGRYWAAAPYQPDDHNQTLQPTKGINLKQQQITLIVEKDTNPINQRCIEYPK